MQNTPPQLPIAFDADPWLWALDEIQHNMYVMRSRLMRRYVQMRQENKQGVYLSADELADIIEVTEESATQTRAFLESTVNSLSLEHIKRLQDKDLDLDLAKQSLQVTNDIALTLCDKLISPENKNNI